MKAYHNITPILVTRMALRVRLVGTAVVLAILVVLTLGRGQAEILSPAPTPFLRVLGTAQDGGLPHASCSCDRCVLARHDPEQRRRVASLALVLPADDEVYLFDATPDLPAQLTLLEDRRGSARGRVDRSPLSGIFLTHAHIGHYLGLAYLGYEVIHTQDLRVVATPSMAAFLRANGPWSQLVNLRNITLEELAPGGRYQIGSRVEVSAVRSPHRDEYADTVGYLVGGPKRRVLYLPDTDSWSSWQEPVAALLQKVDIALVDGTFFSADELPGRSIEEIGHPLIQESMDLFQDLVDNHGLEIYFTHLNHSNPALDPASAVRKQIEERGFHVLEEGKEFTL